LLDKDLFSVNLSKGGLKNKRDKLKADRFKIKNTEGNLRSKTEVALMKKLAKKGPAAPVKKEVELFDVWGSSSSTAAPSFAAPSKNIQKFKDFSNRSMTRVKAVMAPYAGQSVNPALQAHKEVLKKIISEEEKEIEENYKVSFQRSRDEGNNALAKLKDLKKTRGTKGKQQDNDEQMQSDDSNSDESDSDESDESDE
jgi:hypothetical protein